MTGKAEKIVMGLGGIENIEAIGCCITRLSVEVHDSDRVDESALKRAGALGMVKLGTAVQIVVGTDTEAVAADIEDML